MLDLGDGPLARAAVIADVSISTARTRLTRHARGDASGRPIARREFDAWLLDRAIDAGARFEPGVTVTAPLVDSSRRGGLVRGVVFRSASGVETRMPATLVIAADGARSTLAAALGLRYESPHARWAAVAHARDVKDRPNCLDVHLRADWRLIVTPLADCRRTIGLVTSRDLSSTAPLDAIRSAIASDDALARELSDVSLEADARATTYRTALARAAGVPGLLLAGDAASAGAMPLLDGVTRAIVGAQLAVTHGLRALETGDFESAIGRYADDRRRAFGRTSLGDRCLRALGSMPTAIDLAAAASRVVPAIERVVVDGVLRG